MSQKPCPKCDCQISEKATVCSVCKSNLSSRSARLRDIPLAILAPIAALFSPSKEAVRQILGWDVAKLDGHVLSFGILYVGSDDRPAV
jgi:hypothetical protein